MSVVQEDTILTQQQIVYTVTEVNWHESTHIDEQSELEQLDAVGQHTYTYTLQQ